MANHYNNSVIALISVTNKFKYKGKKIIQEIIPAATMELGNF